MNERGGNLGARLTEVMCLVAEGHSNKEIARDLGIGEETVKTYVWRIMQQTGAKNRAVIASECTRMMLTEAPPGALAGYWLSRFDFDRYLPNSEPHASKFRKGGQINIEFLGLPKKADGYFDYHGHNPYGASTLPVVYRHFTRLKVCKKMVVGTWVNDNSGSVGSLELCLHNDLSAMHGGHLGNTSIGVVKAGRWVWLRVLPPCTTDRPDPKSLHSFARLDEIFRSAAERQVPDIHFESLFV